VQISFTLLWKPEITHRFISVTELTDAMNSKVSLFQSAEVPNSLLYSFWL